MTDALTQFGNFDSIAKSAAESQQQVNQELDNEGRGGISFADFRPFGEQGDVSPWEFGPPDEKQQIHPDSEWIIDPNSFMHGWMGFKKGKGGKLIQGQTPDKILTPWFEAFPPQPTEPDMSHVDGRTWQFRCICRSSPIEEHVGVLLEVTDYRRMKDGYAELEKEMRARLQEAVRIREQEGEEKFQRFWISSCPVVRFGFKIGVETNYGPKNKGILIHAGWDMPVVVEDDVQGEEEPEGLDEAVSKAKAEPARKEAPVSRRRGRRDA